MLGIDEITEISERVQEEFNDRIEEILITLNQTGRLEDFLSLVGMSDLLGTNDKPVNKYGKIIVIGASEVDERVLAGVAKSFGFDKDRFEFYLSYEFAKTFNFKKTLFNDAYSAIVFGPVPHSGHAKDAYSSIITAIENEEGYPRTARAGTDGLKITKSSFRKTLQYLIDENAIA